MRQKGTVRYDNDIINHSGLQHDDVVHDGVLNTGSRASVGCDPDGDGNDDDHGLQREAADNNDDGGNTENIDKAVAFPPLLHARLRLRARSALGGLAGQSE